jgi:murein tripeptide amidase MpaA
MKKDIYINDLQELISREKEENEAVLYSTDAYFQKYHKYEEVVQWMRDTAEKYKDLVGIVTIGQTYEKRDILGLKIKGNSNGTTGVVFHGVEHAREWISGAVVSYIAEQLLALHGKDEEITSLVNSFEWTIIPVLNVDGCKKVEIV